MTKEYIDTKQVTAWPQEKDGKEGYAVKYADGYISWSPKNVFEAAHINIGHASHLPSYQRSVIAEKAMLDDKVQKLGDLLASGLTLGFSLDERHRMVAQHRVMVEYADILAQRIAAF